MNNWELECIVKHYLNEEILMRCNHTVGDVIRDFVVRSGSFPSHVRHWHKSSAGVESSRLNETKTGLAI